MANTLNAASQADACRETSPIERAFNELMSTIEEVDSAVDILERKISPGMAPCIEPTPSNKPDQLRVPDAPRSAVRETINVAYRHTERILQKLHSLNNRIEL